MLRQVTAALTLSALAGLPLAAQANVIPGAWSSVTFTGPFATLRAGSIWAPPPPGGGPSLSIIDNVFLAEGTQWNDGAVWWDQDPSVTSSAQQIFIVLDGVYQLDRFVVQADNNDNYLLEYWDGSGWQTAFNAGAVAGAGMRTRDSGLLSAISTDRLRFTANGGDNYYSVSEIQAFATRVSEPGSAALLAAGLLAAGLFRRQKPRG